MIIPTGRADQALGVHLQKIYKTNAASAVEGAERKDMVAISKFSSLVEHGRKCALSLPDIRAGRVAQAREELENGMMPLGDGIASSIINRAAKGEV